MATTTFQTLYQYAQRHYLDRTDDQAVAVCKECVNRGFKRIAKSDHPYYVSRGVINLVEPITSGTIAVSEGATSATITSSPGITSSTYSGRCIIIDSEEYHYDLSTFTSTGVSGIVSISFGNSAKWLNDTVTSASITVYQDIYDLPSDFRTVGEMIEPNMMATVTWLPSPSEWYYQKIRNHSLTGDVRWGCLANGQVRLWPYPESVQVISFPYYRWPATLSSDSTVMDFDDNQIELVYRAIEYELALERGKDEDKKRALYDETLRDILAAASAAHDTFEIGGCAPRWATREYTIGDDSA